MTASAKPPPSEGLERAYRRYERPMLRAARTWFPGLRGVERDLYQGAWAAVLRDGNGEQNLEKRLEHAVYWQGLQELRTRRRRPTVSLDAARAGNGAHDDSDESCADPADLAALPTDEQAEIRAMGHLAREVIADLTPLQQRIIKIQWGWGVPRRQVAALLGISERTLKRELAEAMPVITRNVELVEAERWCDSRRSLVVAYACRVLGGRRTAMAEQHLEHCPGCRELVRAVSQRLDGLAAITPAAPALEPPAERALPHIGAPFEWMRSGIGDLAGSAKQQAVALLTRTPAGDTGAVQLAAGGGLRGTGGMAATVVACVAVGGGATYCAIDGVPQPFRDSGKVAESREPKRDRERKRASAPDERSAQAVASPVTAPVEASTRPDDPDESKSPSEPQSGARPPEQVPQPPPPPDEAAPSPAPSGGSEFGAASAPTPAPSAPAPAPTGGGGEFGP